MFAGIALGLGAGLLLGIGVLRLRRYAGTRSASDVESSGINYRPSVGTWDVSTRSRRATEVDPYPEPPDPLPRRSEPYRDVDPSGSGRT